MKRDEAWLADYQARRASRIAPPPAVSVPKFGNVKTNGYASKREAKRAAELQLLERAGTISGLREQPKYLLVPKQEGERALHYIADFEYVRDGKTVVEDCKGFKTDVYRIKRKLMRFLHNVVVTET